MRGRTFKLLTAAALVLAGAASLAACGSSGTTTTSDAASTGASPQATKLVVGVTGAACEAPLIVAKEKGFFAKNGLDVNLQMLGFDQIKVGLATGKVAAVVGNLEWIKPIEEGLDVKFIQGLHMGCIEGVSPKGSSIKTVADLKGKRLGINGVGDYPDVLARTALLNAGLDPDKDVTIKAYPGTDLPLALKKGEIDAFIMWDPIPSQYIAENGGNIWLNQSETPPFDKQYCCMLVVPGSQVDADPDTTKALSSAVTEAVTWVGEHPDETAQIEIDGKWVAGTETELAEQIGSYGWEPSGSKGKESLLTLAQELQKLGILNDGTDPQQLVDTVYRADLSAAQ
jgi:NitT/TauT family transport system substrate-binding protein